MNRTNPGMYGYEKPCPLCRRRVLSGALVKWKRETMCVRCSIDAAEQEEGAA